MMRISENIKLVNFQYIVLFPTSILLLWPQRGRKGESYFRERIEYDLGKSPSDRRGSRKKPSSQKTKWGCGVREPGHIRLGVNSPRHSQVRLQVWEKMPHPPHTGADSRKGQCPETQAQGCSQTWCPGAPGTPNAQGGCRTTKVISGPAEP